jgi:hypothetical protein
MTYAQIVSSYVTMIESHPSYRSSLRKFLGQYSRLSTLADAIDTAVLCNHPHQNCLSWKKRQDVHRHLLKSKAQIQASATFEELHAVIAQCVRPPFQAADLLIYDLSIRIGAWLGLKPALVYLHRGTREGARALFGRRLPNEIACSEFPPAFRRLPAIELDDLLCIYKAEIALARN